MAKKDSTTPEANASDINSKIPEVAFKARQKTGGRQKGTPNKTTALTKAVIAELLNDYYDSGLMASDFLQLDSKDRITMAEKLMQYNMPKMQATSVDFGNMSTKITIESQLRDLSVDPDETEQ